MELGLPVPVVITVYADKTFTFVTKRPRLGLLKKAQKLKGFFHPNTNKVAKVSREQLEEIVRMKTPD